MDELAVARGEQPELKREVSLEFRGSDKSGDGEL